MKNNEWSLFHSETKIQLNGLDETLLRRELLKYQIKDLEHLYVWCESFSDWRLLREVSDLRICVEECILHKPKGIPPPFKLPPSPPPPPGGPAVPTSTGASEKHPVARSVDQNEQNNNKQSQANVEVPTSKQKTPSIPAEIPADFKALPQTPELSKITNLPEINFVSISNDNKNLQIDERRQFERHPIKMRVIIRSKELSFRTFTTNISLGGVALEHSIPEQLLNHECQILIAGNETQENIRFSMKLLRPDLATRFQFDKKDQATVQKLQNWIERFIKSQKQSKITPKVS